MPEIWQQALSKWDKWNESISDARGAVESQPGDIAQLLARAKTTWPEEGEVISFPPIMNTEAEILWNLYDEVQDIGNQFIAEDVGLKTVSLLYHELHSILLSYWIHLVIPELTQDFEKDYYLQEYLAEKERSHVWFDSKVERRHGKTRIIDRIYWQRGKIQPSDIVKILQNIKRPSSKQLSNKAKGGRPSEKLRIRLEAVICALLKDEQGMTYREITQQFGWLEPESEFENKKKISQTTVNRVRLGREILHYKK